jgi:hypothetical protein
MAHRGTVALAFLACAWTTCGCGESTKSRTSRSSQAESAQATATTIGAQKEFIVKADAICAQFNIKRAPLGVRTEQDWARVLPLLAADENMVYLGLSSLHSPPVLAGDWTQIVGGIKGLVKDIVTANQYAQTNRIYTAGPVFRAFQRTRLRIRAIARHDGFSDCSQI